MNATPMSYASRRFQFVRALPGLLLGGSAIQGLLTDPNVEQPRRSWFVALAVVCTGLWVARAAHISLTIKPDRVIVRNLLRTSTLANSDLLAAGLEGEAWLLPWVTLAKSRAISARCVHLVVTGNRHLPVTATAWLPEATKAEVVAQLSSRLPRKS